MGLRGFAAFLVKPNLFPAPMLDYSEVHVTPELPLASEGIHMHMHLHKHTHINKKIKQFFR